jgi:small GTP-binding protein
MKTKEIIQTYKIFLLSCDAAGKTCIIKRYVENRYTPTFHSTPGMEFYTKEILLDNGKKVRLEIFDTNFSERYLALFRNCYKRVDGIILIYDVTNRNSFEKLDHRFNDIIYCYSKYIPIFLVGNKIDEEDRREITFAEGEEFSKKHGLMFCECSAKTGENIDFIFNKLANEINPEEEERKTRKLEIQKFEEEPKRIEEEIKKERKRIEEKEKEQKKIRDNLLKYLSY